MPVDREEEEEEAVVVVVTDAWEVESNNVMIPSVTPLKSDSDRKDGEVSKQWIFMILDDIRDKSLLLSVVVVIRNRVYVDVRWLFALLAF